MRGILQILARTNTTSQTLQLRTGLTGQTVRRQRSSCRRRNLFTLAQFPLFFFHFLLLLRLLEAVSRSLHVQRRSSFTPYNLVALRFSRLPCLVAVLRLEF